MENTDCLLEVMGLTKYFGGLGAVVDLNLVIRPGEILALIGPNGAGKTTAFNLITGFLPPSGGKILYKGEDVTHVKPHERARKGIVRAFQSNILFMNMSVRENVIFGFHIKYRSGFLREILNTDRFRRERREFEKKADEILDFLHLADLKDQIAANLTHGHQRMLGVAIGLAAGPELFLLDEPVTGMIDEEIEMMMGIIRTIRDNGVTVLLVEHHMRAVMNNCERIVVMDYGKKIAEGTPLEISNNDEVIEAYLGGVAFDAT